MFASPTRSMDPTIVGGWPFDLQLHQQRRAARASAHLTTSLVLPPDSEIVAPVSVRSLSGARPGQCSLIEPCMTVTEEYGVLVGHTLVDASKWSANVLMVNSSSEVVVLPSFTCVGDLVPVLAVSVARSERESPGMKRHLEDIWGRRVGRHSGTYCISMLMCFRHPVTGHTTSVQHEIVTMDARPVWCRPRRLALFEVDGGLTVA